MTSPSPAETHHLTPPRPNASRADRPRPDAGELLARIGARLGGQRVELFTVVDQREAVLSASWTALDAGVERGTLDRCTPPTTPIPIEWFPWSLGNIKPAEYVLVRNASTLPLHIDADLTVRDLDMGSALYLPVLHERLLVGALAVYWVHERQHWSITEREGVCSWALEALESLESVVSGAHLDTQLDTDTHTVL